MDSSSGRLCGRQSRRSPFVAFSGHSSLAHGYVQQAKGSVHKKLTQWLLSVTFRSCGDHFYERQVAMYFILPLIAHVLAGLSSVIIGIVAFVVPKRRGRHPRWGSYYLWTYSLVFLSATILSYEHWQKDSYLFYTAL